MRSVRDTTILTLLWVGRLLFKGAALIVGLMLIVAVWFWDASLLTEAADQNLHLISERRVCCPMHGRAGSRARCGSSVPIGRCC